MPNLIRLRHCATSFAAMARASLAAAALLVGTLATAPAHAADPAQLTIANGVVVKFGPGAGLQVRDRLFTGAGVTFTSMADDSVGGQVRAAPGTPQRGDWLGLLIEGSVTPQALGINGLALRYGGGSTGLPAGVQGGAALVLPGGGYGIANLQATHSTVGVRVIGSGAPSFSQSRLVQNATGLLAEQGAAPAVEASDLSANTDYGVRNTQPAAVVRAQGNWWGHATGPRDPVANPGGQGSAVSSGVDYGQYLQAEPVLTCTMAPTAGYFTRTRQIALRLDCPQAAQYRIAEQTPFTTEPWQNMAGTPTLASYTLSSTPGDKMLHVEFRTAQGSANTFSLAQPIGYAPAGPLVTIDQPAAGAVLAQDTLVSLSATDPDGVASVELLLGTQRLALWNAPPYQTTWALASVPNGTYVLNAKATGTSGITSTTSRSVVVQKQGGPSAVVSATFGGSPLVANATLTQPGLLAITAQSPVGVARIQASVNGAALYSQTYANTPTATASQFIDFAQLPNGAHTLAITATDADSGQTVLTIPFTLDMSAPPAPAITAPAGGAKVSVPQVGVAGTAQPGASVRLYLNGQSTGNPLAASASGAFSGQVTLAEGTHQLTARASNSRGQGPASSAVAVTYTPSVPTVVFVNPPEGAVLSANTTLEVSALDAGGIAKVEFLANGQPLASRTSAPWSVSWPAATLADGAYTLQAIATNTAGKTAQASRSVQVQKVVPPPPPPPPPYVARNVTATPALSFGQSSVQIQGEAVSSEGAQPMPNAALRMVLRVQGFERRFNLVSDAAGRFAYTFALQANDAGSYEVRVIHPDVTTYAKDAPQAVFTINRLGVNYAQYTLNAIRGFASTAQLSVTASSGTGATGVHWQALAADQPSGALPPGITLDLGSPVNIAAGTSAPVNIQLTGGPGAGESGTILLKLFATESGSQPRAELRLDYRLHEARPGLTPSPTALELGVQQGKSISGKLTLTNKGYAPAQNVQVALQARGGGAAPAWVSLDSAPDIGAIDLGQSALVQITARPGTDVADGYHQLQLRISAANDAGGTVPITIAVARDGQGTARFKLVDIYTGTLDAQGQPVEGLAGARITLQNEALTGDIRSATSNAQGIAEYTAIPPGNYRWRASAPRHQDASGRLTVYPGVTANERVFLDYQVVSIEFSVTETTIKDEYAIVLDATYQTQVPAPVVLLEPMSISLPALQQGEEHTGELTLSNYGLVRADNLQYALPASDANYKYEYFGQLPTQLAAKSRVSIPYRITALQALKSGVALNLAPAQKLEQLTSGKPPQPAGPVQNAIRAFLRTGESQAIDKTASSAATVQAAAKAASCSSYQTQGCVAYDYDCAAGDKRSGSACSSISRVTGSGCSGPSSGGSSPTPGSGGGWPGGWGGGGGAMPLVPTCMPTCDDCSAGGGPGGGGGGGARGG